MFMSPANVTSAKSLFLFWIDPGNKNIRFHMVTCEKPFKVGAMP